MEILPGVGAMGAIPPAVMGIHRLGGGAFLRHEEKSMREVVLHFTMTKEGPKVTEVNPKRINRFGWCPKPKPWT